MRNHHQIEPRRNLAEIVDWEEDDDEDVPQPANKDANPTGYVAAGNLDFSKRPRLRVKKPEKSMWVAYFLWLVGGWCFLHLWYLRRDKQLFIWYTTIGGYLGLGLLRDFFRIPAYVRDINESEEYMKNLTDRMTKYKKPPFSLVRFVGQIFVGNSWNVLVALAVPREEIFGVSPTPLIHLSPIGTALAVWMVGNIGREQGEFKWALMGAFIVLPFSLIHPPLSNFNCVTATILFTMKGKQWRKKPYPKTHWCKRLMVLFASITLFNSLWVSHLYFNAMVTDKHGEEIKLRDAAANFLKSPMVQEFKRNVYVLYNDTLEHGFAQAWNNLIELLDPQGEAHAVKVLGLKNGATEEDITSTYRKLAKEYHPDKYKGDPEEAKQRFMEVRAAYETLSHIYNKRMNRKMRKGESEHDKQDKKHTHADDEL